MIDWDEAAERLRDRGVWNAALLPGQVRSLAFLGERLPKNGVILADEVGLGKTRVACAVIRTVLALGGRVAAVVPRGLMHQWQDEMDALGSSLSYRANRVPRARRLQVFGDLFERPIRAGGLVHDGEWVLVSHAFELPRARRYEDQFVLPGLVEARRRASKARLHPNSTYAKLLVQAVAKDIGDELRRESEVAAKLAEILSSPEFTKMRALLAEVPVALPRGSRPHVLASFKPGSAGRNALTELIRAWVGTFDLVVVDEAHKSREEDDEDGHQRTDKMLGRVLELLDQEEGARAKRLCLTATPLELHTEQWTNILSRARAFGSDRASVEAAIAEFGEAAEHAAEEPDVEERLRRLEKASVSFERALRPCVTRRLRRDEGELLEFQKATGKPGHHPHRLLQDVLVHWSTDVSPGARQELIWLEGLAAAVAGLPQDLEAPSALRHFRTTLAAGHVSAEVLLDRLLEEGTVHEFRAWIDGHIKNHRSMQVRGKLRRVRYVTARRRSC